MKPAPSPPAEPPYTVVGRYAIFDEIASGGMASVHLGRLLGAAGFSRTVAIKRLHPQFARDAEFSTMFVDEARLAARIHHPNVVQTIDVVPVDKEILLVMEYVHGAPFAHLLGTSRRAGLAVPPRIIAGVMVGALEGLHAAHEAKSEKGTPLGVVHRDVSPQNILVGVEGVPRVIDFGVAKAIGKMHATREGQIKGKIIYMSPEQVRGVDVTRVSDVFSASIVLWEALVGERLFDGANPAEILMKVLIQEIVPPREKVPGIPAELEAVVMKGLAREPADRFATAREMAAAIEAAIPVAPAREIADWVEGTAGAALASRARLLEVIERVASAPEPGGERTRIEGIKSLAGLPMTTDLESGPRPIAGALPSDETSEPRPIAGALSSEHGGGLLEEPSALPAPSEPTSGVAPKLASVAPKPPAVASRPPPVPTKPAPAAPAPVEEPAATPAPAGRSPLDPVPVRRTDAAATRGHRIPLREDVADRSFVERLAWPIRLVVAGVAVSLFDFVLRQLEITLPVRPSWLAAVLVGAGVIWAFVLVARWGRDEDE